MDVSIHDLPASVIAKYEATARERGIALDQFLREYLIRNAPSALPAQMPAVEWEMALDECFDSFPATGPCLIMPSAERASTLGFTPHFNQALTSHHLECVLRYDRLGGLL